MAFISPYKEKPIPLAKEIVCARCGRTFYTRKAGQGMTKYCGDCKVTISIEKNRVYNRASAKKRRDRRRLERQGVVE